MSARGMLAAALVVGAVTAHAAPKKKDARAHFDRGVAAYTKGDYAAAVEALGMSFAIEKDPETLFAWAQTERKLGHCPTAIELYKQLLTMKMPAANKQAVQVQIRECSDIIAADQKPNPDKTVDAKPVEQKHIEQEPVEPKPVEPVSVTTESVETAPAQDVTVVQPEQRSWWKDPIGGVLVGAGAIGIGLGVVFIVQARAADSDKNQAASYPEYESLADRAESRGRLGVISLVAGGALALGGIAWYATHKPSSETRVTTMLLPSGGGLAVSGSF
jgi:hypothetical protein